MSIHNKHTTIRREILKVNERTITVNCNRHTLIHSLCSSFTRHASVSKPRYINNCGGLYASACGPSDPTYSRSTVMSISTII